MAMKGSGRQIHTPSRSGFRAGSQVRSQGIASARPFGTVHVTTHGSQGMISMPQRPARTPSPGLVPATLGISDQERSMIPHGKVVLTVQEAQGFLHVLDVITQPIDEAIAEQDDIECVRDLEAGSYPLIVKVRDRLRAELARGAESFTVSPGELNVIEKGVSCAEAIGQIKVTRKVVATAGIGGSLLLLFLLV